MLYALLACNFNLINSIVLLKTTILQQLQADKLISIHTILDSWSIFVFCFILVLGIIIELMQHGGSFIVFKQVISKLTNKAKNIQIISLLMSNLLMIDDYLSCLTVGRMMSPIFDKFKITRTKLAFLVDSMSAPLAILCPISSWAVVIIGVFNSPAFQNSSFLVHFSGNSLARHLYVLPYMFYSFAVIFACWFIVLSGVSFGEMDSKQYLNPETKDNDKRTNAKILDLLIPILSLFIGITVFNLIFGHYHLLGGNNSFLEAFQTSNTAAALFFASFSSMLITSIWMLYRGLISLQTISKIYLQGINKVYSTIFILLLSWTIGSILTQNLNIGAVIIDCIGSEASVLMFPVIFFILSLITGFITGTSWGTVAIVAPIAISVFDQAYINSNLSIDPLLLMVCLGSTMSGSIAGDHLSPISSTTVMTASSTEVLPITHTKTQLYYSIPVVISSLLAFYLAARLVHLGVIISSVASIVFALILISCSLYWFSWRFKRNIATTIDDTEIVYL